MESSDEDGIPVHPQRRTRKRLLPEYSSDEDDNYCEIELRMVRAADLGDEYIPRNQHGYLDENNNLIDVDDDDHHAVSGVYDRHFQDGQLFYLVRWAQHERFENYGMNDGMQLLIKFFQL